MAEIQSQNQQARGKDIDREDRLPAKPPSEEKDGHYPSADRSADQEIPPFPLILLFFLPEGIFADKADDQERSRQDNKMKLYLQMRRICIYN